MEHSRVHPVTMAQVAMDAGVSIPTVSRVVNSSAPVSEHTRLGVLESIERLGFHPNPMARGLSRGHSDTVLVILPHITEPSVALRLSGLIGVLRESPYELHVVDVERPVEERLHPIGEIVLQNRPAGVVIISLPPDDDDLRRFGSAGAPIVLVDAPTPDLPNDSVDDVAGGRIATQHLIDLGHTRIGFLGDREDTTIGVPASANRRIGYEQTMLEAQLQIRREYVGTAPHGSETAAALAEKMLALPEPPTAIFAASDVQAFGVLAAARSARVKVPRTLSVIGFDDIHFASLMGLTTVRQPLEISGRRAGIQLLEMLGHRSDDMLPEFPPLELVVRETTAPPATTATQSASAASIEAAGLVTKVSSELSPASPQGQQVPRRKQ